MPSSIQIDRRTLLQILARGGLVLSLSSGVAEAVWGAIAAEGVASAPRVLSPAQTDMIAVIADAILPRSDTPSATDVGVLPWIDLVLAEYFSDARRSSFLKDLAAIDEFALSTSGAHLALLKDHALAKVIATLDAASGTLDLTPPQRGYVHLKELVIHGYFTSKPVQQDILKFVIMPGRFDANVPMAPPSVT
jgi:Gluconate 2-dehydrogenase subunit 3